MQPLLTSLQIRQTDAYTIANEPIASIDLMERASAAFVNYFAGQYPDKANSIAVYCGTGNNGGDGLAIARMLDQLGYKNITVKVACFSERRSDDFTENFERLRETDITFTEMQPGDDLLAEEADIIIDALLGTGLNKPLHTDYARLVGYLNSLHKPIIAVDVPTGLFCEGEMPAGAVAIHSALTITFQQPRINFLLPESAPYIQRLVVVDIGLDAAYMQSLDSPYQLVEDADIRRMFKPRKLFSHKGTYGHALIIAGQAETMGAALLCASACVYGGAGLTTACIPVNGLIAMNTTMPEVMALLREGADAPLIPWDKFSVTAIGPGLGKAANALALLKAALANFNKPMVIDADGLNLLADNPGLIKSIPKGSVITPHVKEFDRLFGAHSNWWARLQTMRLKAGELDINIVLKNQYTITATPQGMLYFNPTGNPAMASGGMGDVLTGLITALIAQQYTPAEACVLGVYLHGKSGDDLALPHKLSVVLAGQVARHIPAVIAKLKA